MKLNGSRCGFVLASAFFLLLSGCIGRHRASNIFWQMDSLRFYTLRIDSMIHEQSEEIKLLRIDYYVKANELGEKIEMLNSRVGDMESQLTMISEKLGSRKAVVDSDDLSGISPEARLIYEAAYMNYVKGNYDEAINGFQSYLQLAPDSPLSDNAVYWIGECYLAMGKSQNAVNAFQDMINRYPQSNKRPTALYKIGLVYEMAKDQKTARQYYGLVIKDFPNSPEAALARDKLK